MIFQTSLDYAIVLMVGYIMYQYSCCPYGLRVESSGEIVYIAILLIFKRLAFYLNAQLLYNVPNKIVVWTFGWCAKRNLLNYVERFHPILHWDQSWQFGIFVKPRPIISLRDRHFSLARRVFSCWAPQWCWGGIPLQSSLLTIDKVLLQREDGTNLVDSNIIKFLDLPYGQSMRCPGSWESVLLLKPIDCSLEVVPLGQ